MPAARPRASFEPIPPDFDVRTFVETADNFQYVDRISYEMITNNGMDQFEKLVLLHVIIGGKPLVIDGFEEVLDPWTFTPAWLRDNHGDKVEHARNLTTKESIPLTIKHYLKHLGKLTDQFFDAPERYRDKTRQRIYLKDIDCPPVWQDKLKEHIPSSLSYLNESTGEIGGPGAMDEAGFRKGRGIARAGDLMSSLPPEMRAENLMCYIGHEGTYTPSHREMCASLGQNIMVNASGTISEDGKPEQPGSSLWFMTETKDRQVVSEYWLSILGHDIEVENHFAQLIAWKKAPFKTYVVEQRPGDFILIPPLAPHQVWNRGTRTMKIAWNRTTVETLELAISEALPNSRVVCRDEQYKNKAIIYYTLLKYSNLIKSARAQVELGGEQAETVQRSVKVRQVQRDFKRLFDLYKGILLTEMFAPDSREHPEFIAFDGNVTCAYCRCNIFNRFLTCKACAFALGTETEEPYDICMDCYCMGRSCACQSGYTWVEQWKWKVLIHKYEEWRAQIIDIDGHMTEKTPLPLQEERRYLGKKTLAQVCQEQLKVRPFVDIKQPNPEERDSDDEEIQVNDNGTVKRMIKKRSKQWLSNHKSCHYCLHRHPKWKMAFCSNCDLAYCYGALFRAHDSMPLVMMENPNWKCPHCRRICNTGNCRRDPRQHPYEPKGTLLGHDTKKVADVRSVECLVDFSVSNLNWLREDESNGQNSGLLQRRRDEAERAKLDDPSLDDRFIDEDHHHTNRNEIEYSPVEDSNAGFNDGIINNSLHGESSYMDHDGSLHQGYVEPSSVMYGYQPDHRMYDGFESYYPDPGLNGEIPRLGEKRNREDDEEDIRRVGKSKKHKKRKDEASQPLQPKNASGKQYQKEIERKLLEDAKKEGRFILVAARMKGKSKIVKLSLSSEHLAAFRNRASSQRPQAMLHAVNEPVADARSILESDVLPATNGADKAGAKPKAPTSFRYRVEEDDSYGTWKRDKDTNGGPRPGKQKRKSRFEELTLDSDEEDDDGLVEYAATANRGGRPKGRASEWLARKNQGEEDLPTELPPNFKDGDVNPNREKNRARDRERRKTMPAKLRAQIRPPGARPPRKSTGNMLDEDGIHEDDDTANSAVMLAQSAAAALEASRKAEEEKAKARAAAKEAEKEAEENMKAKMMAAEWAADSDNESLQDFINTLAAEGEPLIQEKEPMPKASPVAVCSGPPKSGNSIFSRPGMSGKKIKIVSAKRPNRTAGPAMKTTATTTVTAPVSTFTSINKGVTSQKIMQKAVELSESSDSEDEIPANAPASKTPAGRPSLKPSRGSIRGRGPGRPSRGRGV
ncbi:hypothetical protein K469DRAFT_688783 [Zopfia rhizophila CBS 207.26]|uniref:JmjC domain-containing protein n=1 Tax=Zopfia rhizophila CBS 207.26 TaxID=1314779 RepID=A0A6A6DX81_9PEZI|nr:hypothetical protein K469DRAFT_688783 [Zopfia rhizophila CBS 207.26]